MARKWRGGGAGFRPQTRISGREFGATKPHAAPTCHDAFCGTGAEAATSLCGDGEVVISGEAVLQRKVRADVARVANQDLAVVGQAPTPRRLVQQTDAKMLLELRDPARDSTVGRSCLTRDLGKETSVHHAHKFCSVLQAGP